MRLRLLPKPANNLYGLESGQEFFNTFLPQIMLIAFDNSNYPSFNVGNNNGHNKDQTILKDNNFTTEINPSYYRINQKKSNNLFNLNKKLINNNNNSHSNELVKQVQNNSNKILIGESKFIGALKNINNLNNNENLNNVGIVSKNILINSMNNLNDKRQIKDNLDKSKQLNDNNNDNDQREEEDEEERLAQMKSMLDYQLKYKISYILNGRKRFFTSKLFLNWNFNIYEL